MPYPRCTKVKGSITYLKYIKVHRKTPTEFLYLDTGAIPLRWIIAQRRIVYLKHIMERHENELLKKVFLAQKENQTKGDFVDLVGKDLLGFNMSYEDVTSSAMSKLQLKKKLKKIAQSVAFKYLQEKLSTHTKVRNITYLKLELQDYLKTSTLSNEEIYTLAAFRSQCVRGIRNNFKKMYGNQINCPLNCNTITPSIDTQEHLTTCKKVNIGIAPLVSIRDIYAELEKQEAATIILTKLLRKRKILLEKIEQS